MRGARGPMPGSSWKPAESSASALYDARRSGGRTCRRSGGRTFARPARVVGEATTLGLCASLLFLLDRAPILERACWCGGGGCWLRAALVVQRLSAHEASMSAPSVTVANRLAVIDYTTVNRRKEVAIRKTVIEVRR